MMPSDPEASPHPIVSAIVKLEKALTNLGMGSKGEHRLIALHLAEVKALFDRCSQRIASLEKMACEPLTQENVKALSRLVAELETDLYTLLPDHVKPLKKRLSKLAESVGSLKPPSDVADDHLPR